MRFNAQRMLSSHNVPYFADTTPVMLMTEASLKDLADRHTNIKSDMDIRSRFRANFVIDTNANIAYEVK